MAKNNRPTSSKQDGSAAVINPSAAAADVENAGVSAASPNSPAGAGLGLGDLADDAELSAELHGDNEPALNPPVMSQRAKHGDSGRPVCDRHHVLMVAYATKPEATHYKCPAPGCNETAKRPRPQATVPAAPQLCPQRLCQAEGIALVHDKQRSTLAHLRMICPRCGFHVDTPRPEFKPVLEARRRRAAAAELLGER